MALVGLALFADASRIAGRLAEISLRALAAVLGLSLVNYLLRFVRWELYLRHLGVRLRLVDSARVLLVGFVLSVTPGKAGELGKAWLVRELGGGPAMRAVPAVLAERVTDLLGVVLLVALGALAVPGGAWLAAGGLAVAALTTVLVGWRRGARAVLAAGSRLRWIGGHVHHLEELYERMRSLLTARMLLAGLALSLLAWGAEGVGLYVVLRSYTADPGVLRSVFEYAVSTLAGAVSMLPGGLLAAEGSLAALLDVRGLEPAVAASATVIIRAATLWFAVGLGLLALPAVMRRVGRTGGAEGRSPTRGAWRDPACAAGLALLVASLYLLSGPGHIDIVDGQARFEVARSLVLAGRPVVRDPEIGGVEGVDGAIYSYYGPAASVAGVPWVWLGEVAGDRYGATSMFLFTFTSGVFGGLLIGLLYLVYRHLGVGRRAAAGWGLATAFATLVWPLATSSFDQVQQAFFVLAMVWLAALSAARRSTPLALLAGLTAAVLLLYQEALGLLVPIAGLALWRVGDSDRRGGRFFARYAIFLLASGIGFAVWGAYNAYRFGHPFFSGKLDAGGPALPLLGNPLAGFASLLVSPGKGILFFSPLVVLALLGFRGLHRRDAGLGRAAAAISSTWLLFVSCLAFFGGDWSWGPRYLVVILPLWALAFPFAVGTGWRRGLVGALVAASLAVQLLAVSVDHQRFFFEQRLYPFFWSSDPWVYFSLSQLVERPGELADVARPGVPATVRRFSPGPPDHPPTYTPHDTAAGGRPGVEHYALFHLPRPWPLWMPWAARHLPLRVPFRAVLLVLVTTAMAGATLLAGSLRREPPTDAAGRPPT